MAMASLLKVMPHGVPFAQRLELFRSTLAEDKARWGYAAPVAQGGVPPIKVRSIEDGRVLGLGMIVRFGTAFVQCCLHLFSDERTLRWHVGCIYITCSSSSYYAIAWRLFVVAVQSQPSRIG